MSITSEDVTKVLPLPAYLHPNTIGGLFKGSGEFEAIGYAVARNPKAHGRVIRRWSLKNRSVPQKWVSRMEADDGR